MDPRHKTMANRLRHLAAHESPARRVRWRFEFVEGKAVRVLEQWCAESGWHRSAPSLPPEVTAEEAAS